MKSSIQHCTWITTAIAFFVCRCSLYSIFFCGCPLGDTCTCSVHQTEARSSGLVVAPWLNVVYVNLYLDWNLANWVSIFRSGSDVKSLNCLQLNKRMILFHTKRPDHITLLHFADLGSLHLGRQSCSRSLGFGPTNISTWGNHTHLVELYNCVLLYTKV